MNAEPTGEDALALCDAVATIGRHDGFYELKNSGRPRPELPSAP